MKRLIFILWMVMTVSYGIAQNTQYTCNSAKCLTLCEHNSAIIANFAQIFKRFFED